MDRSNMQFTLAVIDRTDASFFALACDDNPSTVDNIAQFETLVQTNDATSNTPDVETLSRTVDANTRSG